MLVTAPRHDEYLRTIRVWADLAASHRCWHGGFHITDLDCDSPETGTASGSHTAFDDPLPRRISHPCTASCEFARQTATSAPFILCRDWPILSVLAGVVSKEGHYCPVVEFSYRRNCL